MLFSFEIFFSIHHDTAKRKRLQTCMVSSPTEVETKPNSPESITKEGTFKMMVLIPPIKYRDIKSKLVKWIDETLQWDNKGIWIEPFMGSGVVGFNCTTIGNLDHCLNQNCATTVSWKGASDGSTGVTC